jgi:hypothetical protein
MFYTYKLLPGHPDFNQAFARPIGSEDFKKYG